MKRTGYISILFFLLALSVACKKEGGPSTDNPSPDNPPVDTGLPVPPDEVNSANVFMVDLFSTLEDDGNIFEKMDIDVASQYIKDQKGKMSVAYIFDRADFKVGVSHPLNKMSYDIGIYQFFAQNQDTGSDTTEGTGIATRYHISDFDGMAQNKAFMSGCKIPVPLKTAIYIYVYTSRIETLEQIQEIYKARSNALLGDAVIVGTVKNDVKSSVLKYIEETMSLRAVAYGSDNTELDLLVVVPASYICRDIENGKKEGVPYYRVSIEKWM